MKSLSINLVKILKISKVQWKTVFIRCDSELGTATNLEFAEKEINSRRTFAENKNNGEVAALFSDYRQDFTRSNVINVPFCCTECDHNNWEEEKMNYLKCSNIEDELFKFLLNVDLQLNV